MVAGATYDLRTSEKLKHTKQASERNIVTIDPTNSEIIIIIRREEKKANLFLEEGKSRDIFPENQNKQNGEHLEVRFLDCVFTVIAVSSTRIEVGSFYYFKNC